MIAKAIDKVLVVIRRKIQSQPYRNERSNIGFKAIGKSSDYRTLNVTEGRVYIPSFCQSDFETGGYKNFMITIEPGKLIRIVQSDIGTIFKVIPYVRERLMSDETLL